MTISSCSLPPKPLQPIIGIMQGRLSSPINGKIQAFPAKEWREEFERAASLGLSSIEWIFETPFEQNPLWTVSGVEEIRDMVNRTGVRVDFICADYFMESPLVRMSPVTREKNLNIMKRLLEQAALLGVGGVEIPCVDASAIHSREEEDELATALEPALKQAESLKLEIGLETSLSPDRFRGLLDRIAHPQLKANYDSGNSASLGFDPKEEMDAYGAWINNVHIKDRKLGGGTVPFGTGDVDIPQVLRLLKEVGYSGIWILQGARGEDDLKTAEKYQRQLQIWLKEAGWISN